MPILPDFKFLSLEPTTDSEFVYVSDVNEAISEIAKLPKRLINKIGDAVGENDLSRKDVVRNLQFIASFELDEIVFATNFVLSVREKKIAKANEIKQYFKFSLPYILNIRPVKEKLSDEQRKAILTIAGFL